MANDPLYFIGITPPVEIQTEITRYKEYFRDKYGAGHALKSPPHITLVPPFRFPETTERKLISELSHFAESEKVFTIELENFNAFEPRVIFVNVKSNERLIHLYKTISDFASSHWNLPFDGKKTRHFNAHITLAFRDLSRTDFYDAWQEFKTKEIKYEFTAEGITLFKHNGKKWEILHVARFMEIPEQ
jgi:2'-5' RNA ligase